jgi:catechol 2,3-dioxygenase-like lactoylglutathione lyase family enzyme
MDMNDVWNRPTRVNTTNSWNTVAMATKDDTQAANTDGATDGPSFGTQHDGDHPDRVDEWAAMRAKYLLPDDQRPASSARGQHHEALLSSDLERTIEFYQGLLEFPLTKLFQNRDYEGSTHFFFDIGNGNALAFFDFPGFGLEEYSEVLGGHHHLAISVTPENWERLGKKLSDAGVETFQVSGSSLYFAGPDGERLELISDPLGEMYGEQVL